MHADEQQPPRANPQKILTRSRRNTSFTEVNNRGGGSLFYPLIPPPSPLHFDLKREKCSLITDLLYVLYRYFYSNSANCPWLLSRVMMGGSRYGSGRKT